MIDIKHELKFNNNEICHYSYMIALLEALRLKGEYLHKHCIEVGLLAEKIGIALGYSEEELFVLKTAGFLHDIGKIAIKDDILLKPAILVKAELEQIEQHPEIGARLLMSVPKLSKQAEIILYHHVGIKDGYPTGKGYKGYEDIPFESKIIKICDIFTAMTNPRPHRTVYPRRYAIEVCRKEVPFPEREYAELADVIYNNLDNDNS